jgi:Protein of unknown function (DUF2911)
MTRLIVAAMLCATVPGVSAQRNLLPRDQRPSPHELHKFTLDGSVIEIDYGRPFKKGRTIWGGLVPWGRWWMPGADESTSLKSPEPLIIGGLNVPAGEHTIYMWPDSRGSKLIINNRVNTFHTFYDSSSDLGRADFPWKKLELPIEQMTFSIDQNAGAPGGTFKLIWDDREYFTSIAVKR